MADPEAWPAAIRPAKWFRAIVYWSRDVPKGQPTRLGNRSVRCHRSPSPSRQHLRHCFRSCSLVRGFYVPVYQRSYTWAWIRSIGCLKTSMTG